MSLTLNVAARFTIGVEVPDTAAPQVNPAFAAIALDQLNIEEQLTEETTPELQGEPVDLSKTLTAGSATIDLTAAPIAYRISSTVDLTGKRLIGMILSAPEDNAGAITVKTGAANGYPIGDGITLEPGEVAMIAQTRKVSTRAAVAAGDKILDVTGTGTDEVQILAVFGDA